MTRSAHNISALLQAAGLIEQAREKLNGVSEGHKYREHLKRVADSLAASAVAGKVEIANDSMQDWGRNA